MLQSVWPPRPWQAFHTVRDLKERIFVFVLFLSLDGRRRRELQKHSTCVQSSLYAGLSICRHLPSSSQTHLTATEGSMFLRLRKRDERTESLRDFGEELHAAMATLQRGKRIALT